MRGSVGASETLVRWVVRLSTWESEEKQRRSRKEEKRKWGKCCRHSNSHTNTRTYTKGRDTHTFHSRPPSFVPSFVPSFLRPSPRCGGGPGWVALPPSLPRLLGNPNHPTSRHVCSSLLLTFPPSSSHQNQCLLFFLLSFSSRCIHPSIRPSIRPSVRPSIQPALVVVKPRH